MSAGGMDNASIIDLRAFVARIEHLEDKIAEFNGDKSEVYKDAKGRGFDLPVLRRLIANRRKIAKDPRGVAEQNDILEMYEAALETRPSRVHARGKAAETPHDPETGEVRGSHGSPALDEDAAKLEAMGQDPGPTLGDLDLADDEAMAGSGNFSAEAAAETNRITRAIAEQLGRGAETSRATSSPEVASAPYRVTDPAPAPVAIGPDLSPLVADAAARQAAARLLLGQSEAAE